MGEGIGLDRSCKGECLSMGYVKRGIICPNMIPIFFECIYRTLFTGFTLSGVEVTDFMLSQAGLRSQRNEF